MSPRFHATEEITVEQCLCTCGGFREDCPYALTQRVDYSFAEKEPVDNLEEGHSDMLL